MKSMNNFGKSCGKVTKRLLAALLCVLQLTLLPLSAGALSNGHEYTGDIVVNGYTVNSASVSSTEYCSCGYAIGAGYGQHWCCWNYATALYNKIWSVSFDYSENLIANLSAEQRKITVDNCKTIFSHAKAGANVRLATDDAVGGPAGNSGHSLIFLGTYQGGSEEGAYFAEANYDWCGSAHLVKVTYEDFVNEATRSNTYFKYVIFPGAGAYADFSEAASKSYLNQCKFFPSAGTVKVTAKTYMKTYPCSRKTNEDSDDILKATKGEVYDVTGLYRNSVGNYWFRIGIGAEMGYLYAGDVSFTVADEYKSNGDCFYSTDGKTLKGYIDGTKKSFDSSYVYSAYDDVSENCCYHLYLAANESVVLDAQGDENNTANCSNVWLYKKTSAASSLWSFTKASGGWYVISPESNTGLALNPYAAEPVNGTNVNVYNTNADDATMGWYLDSASDGTYVIRNACNTSLVLTAESSGAGSNVYVANYDASNALQRWKISG